MEARWNRLAAMGRPEGCTARSVNGSSPLFLSLAAGALFLALHHLIAYLSFRWHGFGHLVIEIS